MSDPQAVAVFEKHIATCVVPGALRALRNDAKQLLEVVDEALSIDSPHYPPLHFAHVAQEKLAAIARNADAKAATLARDVAKLRSSSAYS